jgi:hypothetical protein
MFPFVQFTEESLASKAAEHPVFRKLNDNVP